MKNHITIALLSISLCVGVGMTSCVDPNNSPPDKLYEPGKRIKTLPKGYKTEVLGGNIYYYHDGYYYQSDQDSYVVAEAPKISRYYDLFHQHWHNQDRGHFKNEYNGLPMSP